MDTKFIRRYRLTLGMPLSFYAGEVQREAVADPRGVEQRLSFFRQERILTGRNRGGVSQSDLDLINQADRVKFENNFTNSIFLADRFDDSIFRGVEIEDLNISFFIDTGEGNDSSEITVFNLSEQHKQFLEKVGNNSPVVKLQCWYDGDEEQPIIFQGEVIRVLSSFEGATSRTKLIVRTGATNIKEAYSIKSYRAGTPLETIIKEFITDMKLPYGTVYIPRVDDNAIVIDKNLYANGKTIDVLQSLCDNYQLALSVVNTLVNIRPRRDTDPIRTTPREATNQLTERGFSSRLVDTREIQGSRDKVIIDNINARDNVFPERKGYRINTEVGFLISTEDDTLIGSPQLENGNEASLELESGKEDKIKFKALLDHRLAVGKRIELQSRYYSGVYLIEKARFVGEYEGNDWYVECTANYADGWNRQGT